MIYETGEFLKITHKTERDIGRILSGEDVQ